ncbi:hypothetical protein ACFLUH_00170 [Chloroflexota bacterium]
MDDKRMLIVNEEVVRKIDENRGDMNRSEFLNFLMSNRLKEETVVGEKETDYISREEFYEFAQGIKELLRSSLEFFISYGLEMGKEPKDTAFEELTKKLQSLENSSKKAKSSN